MTTHLKTYKPFSVIVIPFPFTDSKLTKKRPAVVLSSEVHQQHNDHVTLLMITSAKQSNWYGDWEILDLESAGLEAISIVRQKIFSLDLRLVIKKIGELSKEDI